MKKILIYILFFTQTSLAAGTYTNADIATTAANIPYDRIIIFGDSLSDTGNTPEPFEFKFESLATTPPPYLLYIPVSNPVHPQLYGTKIHNNLMPSSNWFYPSLSFLQDSIPKQQGTITYKENTPATRTAYSINWPLYLIYNSYLQHLQPLRSWQDAYNLAAHQQSPDQPYSINYAFSSAMSIAGCARDNYKPIKCGSEKNIYQKLKDFRDGKNPSINGHPVPGLIKQVSLYTHDDFAKPKQYSTAYIIYIGGNDIANTTINQFLKFKLLAFRKTIKTEITQNIEYAINQINDYQKQYPNSKYDIYVVNYFNVSKTPRAYHFSNNFIARYFIKKIVYWSVTSYNKSLVSAFNNKHAPHTNLIDLASQLNATTNTVDYKDKIAKGENCIASNPADYIMPSHNMGNCDSYFFWNESHLTTPINQETAFYLHSQLAK